MLEVEWIHCGKGLDREWCSFKTVDTKHPHVSGLFGVYCIFQIDAIPPYKRNTTILVGSGVVGERVEALRKEEDVTRHPDLYVTWAKVDRHQAEGVKRFLADALKPLEGERHPDVPAVDVNLPY